MRAPTGILWILSGLILGVASAYAVAWASEPPPAIPRTMRMQLEPDPPSLCGRATARVFAAGRSQDCEPVSEGGVAEALSGEQLVKAVERLVPWAPIAGGVAASRDGASGTDAASGAEWVNHVWMNSSSRAKLPSAEQARLRKAHSVGVGLMAQQLRRIAEARPLPWEKKEFRLLVTLEPRAPFCVVGRAFAPMAPPELTVAWWEEMEERSLPLERRERVLCRLRGHEERRRLLTSNLITAVTQAHDAGRLRDLTASVVFIDEMGGVILVHSGDCAEIDGALAALRQEMDRCSRAILDAL